MYQHIIDYYHMKAHWFLSEENWMSMLGRAYHYIKLQQGKLDNV